MALIEIKIKANYYNHNVNNNYKFLPNDSKNSKYPIYMITGYWCKNSDIIFFLYLLKTKIFIHTKIDKMKTFNIIP